MIPFLLTFLLTTVGLKEAARDHVDHMLPARSGVVTD